MIKYNKKEETFIIIDKIRTMKDESSVGILDLKALNLNDKLENDEIDKLIANKKSLMNNATDRKTINKDKIIFYFNNFILQEILKFRMMF